MADIASALTPLFDGPVLSLDRVSGVDAFRNGIVGDLGDGVGVVWPEPAAGVTSVAVGNIYYAVAPAGASDPENERDVSGERRAYMRTGELTYVDQGDAAAPVSQAVLAPMSARLARAAGAINIDALGGRSDFDAAMIAAIASASASGGVITLTPGVDYFSRASIPTITGHLPHIDLNGARVIRAVGAENRPILSINRPFTTPVTVTAIEDVDINLNPADETSLTRVTRIAYTGAADFAVGDIGRIVSDDYIPWGRPSDTEKLGESFGISRVVSTAGEGTVYTYRPLRVPINAASNARLARYSRLPAPVIRNWHSEDDVASPTARNAAMIWMTGCANPKIFDPVIRNALAEAIRLTSCHQPYTIGANLDYIRTSAADSAYGYGIREEGCCDGLHIGLHGSNLRHGYTTGALNSLTENDPRFERYGGTVGTRIVGAFVREAEHNGLDTHSDAKDVTFANCKVSMGYRGNQGSLFGIKMRGVGIKAQDCETFGPGAVYLQPETGGGAFKVLGHIHTTPARYGATQAFGGYNYGSGQSKAFIDASIETEADVGTVCGWTGFNIRGDIRLKWDMSGTGSPRAFELTNTRLDLTTLDVEMSGTPSTTALAGAYFNDDASSYRVGKMTMRANGLPWYYANFGPASPGPGNWAASAILAKVETDVAPFGTSGGVINPGASSTYAANVTVSDGVGAQPGSFVVNLTVTYPQTVSLRGRGEDQIVLSLRANSTTVATRELTIGFPPVKAGQRLVLLAQSTSISANQKPVTVKTGTYLLLAGDVVLDAGEALSLVAVQDSSLATPLYWARG